MLPGDIPLHGEATGDEPSHHGSAQTGRLGRRDGRKRIYGAADGSPFPFPQGIRLALDWAIPSRPRGGGASTSQGHSYGVFQKALQRRNVVAAVAAARELPLGHHAASFTLDTYIHLLDDDLPDPAFFEAVLGGAGGLTGDTRATETDRDRAGADHAGSGG